jgi:hypothetical protein
MFAGSTFGENMQTTAAPKNRQPIRTQLQRKFADTGVWPTGRCVSTGLYPNTPGLYAAQPTPAWDYRMGYRLLLQSGWHQPHVATFTMGKVSGYAKSEIYIEACTPSLEQHQLLALRLYH